MPSDLAFAMYKLVTKISHVKNKWLFQKLKILNEIVIKLHSFQHNSADSNIILFQVLYYITKV